MLAQLLAEVFLSLRLAQSASRRSTEDRGLSAQNRDQKYDSSMNTLVTNRAHYLQGGGQSARARKS